MPIIDTHVHLGAWPTPVTGLDVAECERLMKQFGIARSCVASTEAAMGDLAAGNQALAEAIEGHPTLLGYCAINPNLLDLSAEELARHLRRPNFVGAKLQAAYGCRPLDSPPARELVKRSLRYDKPILVEPRTREEFDALNRLAGDFPTAKFVIAAMAAACWEEAVGLAVARTNVIFQCGGAHAARDAVKYAMDEIGPHRVIWGSDAPLAHPVYALGMVRDAELDAGMKDRLLQANAGRVFGIRL